jgi:hypothetical protein
LSERSGCCLKEEEEEEEEERSRSTASLSQIIALNILFNANIHGVSVQH